MKHPSDKPVIRCEYSNCRTARRSTRRGITAIRDDHMARPIWVCSWAHLVALARERVQRAIIKGMETKRCRPR